MKHITQAIRNLLPSKSWKLSNTPASEQEFISFFEIVTHITEEGDAVFSTNPSDFGVTWNQIQEEDARLEGLEITEAYKAKRLAEYPSIADQLDTLYHGGFDAWKATIQTVKEKYPKEQA